MAALWEAPFADLLDLTQLGPSDLDALLAEEIGVWDQRFAWDFRPAADLLRRFLHLRSLSGCALRCGGEIAGYAYYVCEGRKSLIGDFFIRAEHASASREMLLLGGVVRGAMQIPGMRRIESQLMLLRSSSGVQPLPFSHSVKRHDRLFMQIGNDAVRRLLPETPGFRVVVAPWAERYQEEMAHVLAASYRGHVDSEINDQYRNVPGARAFLSNIIRYPGCGRFVPESSVLAIDASTGRLCGMCLASRISADSGHITQVCTLPAIRGTGVGYELLRESVTKLTQNGCTSVSLTVTCSNVDAIRLYQKMGFRTAASFPALVWEGF